MSFPGGQREHCSSDINAVDRWLEDSLLLSLTLHKLPARAPSGTIMVIYVDYAHIWNGHIHNLLEASLLSGLSMRTCWNKDTKRLGQSEKRNERHH